MSYMFRGVTPIGVRADVSDPVAIVNAIKKTFEEFKAENDARLEGIDAKFDDVVQAEKVDRINDEITKLTTALNDLAVKQASMDVPGAADAKAITRDALAFSRQCGLDTPLTGEQYQAYVNGMNSYMRKNRVSAEMSVGSDPEGGFTVPTDLSGRIIKKLYETSDMRRYASVMTIGTDALEGFNDLEEASCGWVGEKETRSETNTPDLGKWSIPVHEVYAMPKVTQKLLDDSMFDIEAFLRDKVAAKMARTENSAFVTGTGILKPRGFLDYSTAATGDDNRAWGVFEHVVSGVADDLTDSDKLIDLIFKLKAGWRGNANWFMNRNSVGTIRKLKDGNGNYLWQPNFEERQGGNLAGYPIAEFEDMPDIAAGALPIAFGDMAETYTIVDRMGIRLLRDPFTTKGYVKLYTTKRVGGDAINFESLKMIKIST